MIYVLVRYISACVQKDTRYAVGRAAPQLLEPLVLSLPQCVTAGSPFKTLNSVLVLIKSVSVGA